MAYSRWTLCLGILTTVGLAGCQQHCFMTEADYHHYRTEALNGVRSCPTPTCDLEPSVHVESVTTVLSPEGEKRMISLAECIALALENGRTGESLDRVLGLLGAGQANPSNSTDSIRVFAYDPAIQGTQIEQSLSKFDAVWRTSMTWNKIDRPVGTALESFQAGNTINEIQQDTAQFQTDLLKPLPTGGLAGITFRTDYDLSNLQQRVNPAYRPTLEFTFEQPLLQGGGLGINRIRTAHPGGIQNQIPQGGRVPGILLARIAYDQSQHEFERRVQDLLLAVEQAYWQLYSAYYDYYSRDAALRYAHIAWQIAKVRHDSGRLAVHDFEQIGQQLHSFRAQRIQALGRGTGRFPGVLEAERRLRYIIGLPPEDGTRLIPLDVPTTAPYQPNWAIALREAMGRRSELVQIRQDIQAAQLTLLREKDFLLPDLRFFSRYDVNALGKHLDGDDENGALRNLAENKFNNWTLGLRMDMPIGHREAHSEVRRAQLELAQTVGLLRDQESRISYALQRSYRELVQFYEEVRMQRARRKSAAKELQSRYELFLAGSDRSTIDVLLESQRNWADALRDEFFAVVDYNIALIDFERQKGTILEYHNVSIADGPLPAYAQCRASEHIRERSRALTLIAPENCLPPDGQYLEQEIVEDPAAGYVVPSEEGEGNVESLPLPQSLLETPEEPTPIPLLLNSGQLDAQKVSRHVEDVPMIAPEEQGVAREGEVLDWPEEVADDEQEFSNPPSDYELPEAPIPPKPEIHEDEPLSGNRLSLELIKPASARFKNTEDSRVREAVPPPEEEEPPLEDETWEIP